MHSLALGGEFESVLGFLLEADTLAAESPRWRFDRGGGRRQPCLAGCGGGDDDDDNSGGSQDSGNNSALTPTAATPAAGNPVKGGTLRSLTNVGSIFDPHRTNTPAESLSLWGKVGNTLVRFSTAKNGQIEGDLAAGLPEIPADGLSLTFKIRPEAKWQNKAGERPRRHR